MRILSLAPSNTEILFSLGLKDSIVGVTTYCDYPEEAKSLPKVGSWIHPKDMTLFDTLKPDIIMTSMFVPPEVDKWCKEHSIPLLNVYPQTLQGIYDSFHSIGKAVGREDEAENLCSLLKKQLIPFKEHKHIKIYSEEFHSPPTVGANWVPELIELAGGIPMGKPGMLSYEVSFEEVNAFDPDLIILHWCGFGNRQKKEWFTRRKGWEELRASKQGSIYPIHDTFLNRPGPRIWQGVKEIHQLL